MSSRRLLGFASHAPGGLGVFDAAILLALPQVGKEQLLAAVVIFRCLYYLVPFCLAVLRPSRPRNCGSRAADPISCA